VVFEKYLYGQRYPQTPVFKFQEHIGLFAQLSLKANKSHFSKQSWESVAQLHSWSLLHDVASVYLSWHFSSQTAVVVVPIMAQFDVDSHAASKLEYDE
jgi:hypothetical protein